ncbi:hypothetical protein B0H19DRAFT_160431 [Mycena capillaripes]|nr:hypothetical protein B0H19DRAFT_160431 [Mycena capillaripes]
MRLRQQCLSRASPHPRLRLRLSPRCLSRSGRRAGSWRSRRRRWRWRRSANGRRCGSRSANPKGTKSAAQSEDKENAVAPVKPEEGLTRILDDIRSSAVSDKPTAVDLPVREDIEMHDAVPLVVAPAVTPGVATIPALDEPKGKSSPLSVTFVATGNECLSPLAVSSVVESCQSSLMEPNARRPPLPLPLSLLRSSLCPIPRAPPSSLLPQSHTPCCIHPRPSGIHPPPSPATASRVPFQALPHVVSLPIHELHRSPFLQTTIRTFSVSAPRTFTRATATTRTSRIAAPPRLVACAISILRVGALARGG